MTLTSPSDPVQLLESDNPLTQGSTLTCVQLAPGSKAFPGYAFGFRQPCLKYTLRVLAENLTALQNVDLSIATIAGTSPGEKYGIYPAGTAGFFARWVPALLDCAAHPVLAQATFQHDLSNGNLVTLLQPCLKPLATIQVVKLLIDALNLAHRCSISKLGSALRVELPKMLNGLTRSGLQGFNPPLFLAAAQELDVPWFRLNGNLIQLGVGKRARWIDSSFTDITPHISTQLARDKLATAALLRRAGVPVPAHFRVLSQQDAVLKAQQLGFPVVVKPADRDGGKGVKAHLTSADAVRRAFDAARALSDTILVEKFVPGNDYRIQVVCGEVQGIIERIPGGITGNGNDSIRTLVDQQNHERKTATDDRRYLHPITCDEEAADQLSTQHLTWDAVPAPGRFVRLRGAANVASGGIPVPHPPDSAHPDNLALARRIVRLLRLDVAGIDFLSPDIGTSWTENGACVCEVNAQPQMYSTLHKPMLARLMQGSSGRIPVVVILADPADGAPLARALHHATLSRGTHAGLVLGGEVWSGEDCLDRSAPHLLAAGRMLCLDPAIELLIFCGIANPLETGGWPVDSCDVLAVRCGPSAHLTSEQLLNLLQTAAQLSPQHVLLQADLPAPYQQGLKVCGVAEQSIHTLAQDDSDPLWIRSIIERSPQH